MMRAVGFCGAAWLAMATATLSAAISASDGFDPNVNGNVYAVAVQPDGKVLIAGKFTTVQPNGGSSKTVSNIARLLPDGTLDSTFKGSVDGTINAIALQADGGIIIGGVFTKAGTATRSNAARLNADGTVDTTFDPNVGGSLAPDVKAVLVQANGQILIGGGFYTVKGLAAADSPHYLARFNADGTLDTTFKPNPDGIVLSLREQPDDKKILVGGGFDTVQPLGAAEATERDNLARFNADGTLDTSFDPAPDDAVNAIAVDVDGRIAIGGAFLNLYPNGTSTAVARSYFARLERSGRAVTNFSPSPGATVNAIVIDPDGGIILGSRTGASRINQAGLITSPYLASINSTVYAIASQADGALIMGGGFNAVTVDSGYKVTRNHVCRLLPGGALDATFNPLSDGRPYAVEIQADGKMLIGGSFSNVAGVNHASIARLNADGSLDSTFVATTNGQVVAIKQLADGSIMIGGTFTYVNNRNVPYLAKLKSDGSIDTDFNMTPDGAVSSIVEQSNKKIIVGGAFTTMKLPSDETSTSRIYIARINADGTLDTTFYPTPNGNVISILLSKDESKIYIGGSFTTLQPNGASTTTSRYSLARLNIDGTVDGDFWVTTDGTVNSLALTSDGSLVFAGTFTQIASAADADNDTVYPRWRMAKVSAAGVVDTTFDPAANNTVTHLIMQDDKIVLAGLFTQLTPNGGSSVERNYIARLNADGTADTTFDLKLDRLAGNEVTALAVQSSDTSLVFAGTFNSLQPVGTTTRQLRNRLVRIKSDGSFDASLDVDLAGQANVTINAVSVDVGGTVVVAGKFDKFNGAPGAGLARFSSDGSSDTLFSANVTGTVNALAILPSASEVDTQMAGLAAFNSDGTLNETFAPTYEDQLTGVVDSIALQSDGRALVGGSFYFHADSSTTMYLARYAITGKRDTTFAPVLNGEVYSVAIQSDGKILIGGAFTTIDSNTQAYLARLNSDGSLDTDFTPWVNAAVYTVVLTSDQKILIGGAFTSLESNADATTTYSRNGLALLAADGTVDTEFDPKPNSATRVITLQSDGKILIGGDFTKLYPNGASTGTARNRIARLTAAGKIDESFNPNADSSVYAIALQSDGKILVGGAFQKIDSTSHAHIARLNTDGSLDTTFRTIANQSVSRFLIDGSSILISGSFSFVGYADDSSNVIARSALAEVSLTDGTIDAGFAPDLDSYAGALAKLSNGAILVGGAFTSVQSAAAYVVGGSFTKINGSAAKNLALVSSHGSLNASFSPSPNGAVNVVQMLPDTQIVVAGNFTQISGVTRNRIARFNEDRSLDTSFNPNVNGAIAAIAYQPDGKLILGGSFTTVGGGSRSYLARINSDGTLDSTFAPTVSGKVGLLALQADGGILYTAESGSVMVLGRLNADGSADTGFTPPSFNGSVETVAVQLDGDILVGGPFTLSSYNYLARLNSDGSLDTGFGTSATPNGAVSALTLQSDGKVLLGGAFSKLGTQVRAGLGRLSTTSRMVQTFSVSDDRSTLEWSMSGSAGLLSSLLVEKSSDASTWLTVDQATRVGTTNTWTLSDLGLSSKTTVYFRLRGVLPVGSVASGFYQSVFMAYPKATPVVTNPEVPTASVGIGFHYTLKATDDPTSFTATGLPAGLTLNKTTGEITGTPTTVGTYTVTLTVKNSSYTTTITFTLTVSAATVPPAPVATAATSVGGDRFTANWGEVSIAQGYLIDIAKDSGFTQLVGTYDANSGSLVSWSVDGLTAATTYYYRVRAYNYVGTGPNSSPITVKTLKNQAPKITSTTSTIFTVGLPSSLTVTATGTPAPTFSATGLPSWASLDATTGVLSGTAPSSAAGTQFPLTITATNGISPNATQSFTLNVQAAPTISTPMLVTTIAGKAGTAGTSNGTGTVARFRTPMGIAINTSSVLYICDTDNHTIRKSTTLGVVSSFAGKAGTAGTANGIGGEARFNTPSAIAADGSGNLYVADTLNHTIRKVTIDGVVSTLAGEAGTAGSSDGYGTAAHFNAPQGVAVAEAGTILYVADTNNETIRKIVITTGEVTTVAGLVGVSGSTNGTGTAARFNGPTGLAVTSAGTIYVADTDNNCIRSISAAGVVSTLAGRPGTSGAADGTGTAARFNHPSALLLDSDGLLYVLDTDNQTIRRISDGAVTTLAGSPGASGTADGLGTIARLNSPVGMAVNSTDEIYFVDTNSQTLRQAVFPTSPGITTQPSDTSTTVGSTVTLSVVATGEPVPTYQWRLAGVALSDGTNANGTSISGATTNTLTLTNVQLADGGDYTVVVTNAQDSVTSDAATLTVTDSSGNSSGGGGGGGAPSLWFCLALALLTAARFAIRGSRGTQAAE